jgi:Tat protein secretion system quality control protein TatD with DNase activity
MVHPRCVGWGEIGLDYHYDNSPRDVQQAVFIRQLKQAVKLGKPLTIHTREAEEDTERILKQEVPAEHKVYSLLFTRDILSYTHPTYFADPCPLFHRLTKFRRKVTGIFPQPPHRNHR